MAKSGEWTGMHWFGNTCPVCNGHGKVPATFDGYKVHVREQSDNYMLNDTFPSLQDAIKAARKLYRGPLGRGFMLTVIGPDGRTYEWKAHKDKKR